MVIRFKNIVGSYRGCCLFVRVDMQKSLHSSLDFLSKGVFIDLIYNLFSTFN